MIGWVILALVVAFFAVLLVRAIRFRPQSQPVVADEALTVDTDAATARLQALIRCKTVSYPDAQGEDKAEFDKLKQTLRELYPRLHSVVEAEEIGDKGVLLHWKGSEAGAPTLLMAHYDVVPVQEDDWEQPSFAGNIVDGVLWGRGTLDTKGTLHGILEAAEALAGQGFTPRHDVYLAFAGDEEVMGHGAHDIVETLKARGVRLELVLDEGGAVVEKVFPGVKPPCAVVGVAEKGSINVDLTATAKGGHASAPAPHTALGLLGRAMARVESKPFPAHFTAPALAMFDTLGRHSSLGMRLIFANLWCFKPLLNLICVKSGGEMNALVRTTCAFTRAQGSAGYNVLEREATVGANLRIQCGESIEGTLKRLKRVIGDERVQVKLKGGSEPSGISRMNDAPWERLSGAIRRSFPDAIVSPYLMLACSDSRHYDAICDHVYRFSGMRLSKEERGLIHNANERMTLKTIPQTIAFFARVLKDC